MVGTAAAVSPRWRAFACAALLGSPLLAGCVDTVVEARSSVARTEITRRADVSPKGAEVALVSVDGAPETVAERFSAALREQAAARDVVFAEPAKARYHLRGYLAATPGSEGVAVTYVWDIFDAGKRRAQRMSDELVLKGSAADPWAALDDKATASLAAKSADDLAAFLSNTPEAIAAARAPAGRPRAAAASSAAPVE